MERRRKNILYMAGSLLLLLVAGLALLYDSDKPKQFEPITDKGEFAAMNLQDFYKINYQQFFGTGHMAPDTAAVYDYLCEEMSEIDSTLNIPDLQYIGGYYRVSLRLMMEGLVPVDTLAYGFIDSARPLEHKKGAWKKRWSGIENKVLEQYPDLADADLQTALAEAAAADAPVHHSEQYRNAYHPHYRLIREDIVDRWQQTGVLKTDTVSLE